MIVDQGFVEAIKQKFKPEDQAKAVALVYYMKKWSNAEQQYQEKVQKLSTDHIKACMPEQQEINALVNGEREPKAEELQGLKDLGSDIKSAEPIPNYWQKVLQHCSITGTRLSQKDVDVLASLKGISAVMGDNDKDFKIKFEFNPNEFFENKVLEKEFVFNDEESDLPYKCNGTQIKWKEGKNVTKTIKKKKQRNKKTNQTRIIESEVKLKSFFKFFDDIAPAQTDEEELVKQEQIAGDLSVGEAILEEIIPESLVYYFDMKDEEGEEEDDEDVDEDDEDDDDD